MVPQSEDELANNGLLITNYGMKVSVEELGACKRVLRVELPPESVRPKVEEVYRQLERTVKIPGFRKGKAPRRLLEARFRDEVRSEVVRDLVPATYRQALEESHLTPISEPEVEEIQFEEDKPFVFKATFEVKPEFEVKDYRRVVVSKEPLQVTEEEVDRALELMRERAGEYLSMEGWPALRGDLVYLDFEGLVEGRPFKGGKGENQPLLLGSQGLLPGFDEKVIGLGKGESKAFGLDIPEDFPRKDLAGNRVTLKITVKEIKKKRLPQLDDDFAKGFGGCGTLRELREKVRCDLLRQKEKAQEMELKGKIVEKVVDAHSLEVPEALVEAHLRRMVSQGIRRLAAQGVDVKGLAQDPEALRGHFREAALKEAKATLVLEAIADKEGIQVSEEELAKEVEAIAASVNLEPKAMRTYLEGQGRWEAFRAELREQKAVDFLYAQARVVEGGGLIVL